jgi:hypothetical protein
MKMIVILSCLSIILGIAAAAEQCNQFEIALYGRVWQVTSYYVQDDIVINPNRDYEMLQPDGLACREGVLYVSGDREEWSTNSRLAVYAWESNMLSYSGFMQLPNTSPDWWGADGITFNKSVNPNSYGGGLDELVAVEADDPAQVGIIDLSESAVGSRMPLPPAQDIAFLSGTEQFAVITDGAETSTVTLYDKQMTAPQGSFFVIASAKGLASLSADFGQWMSREEGDPNGCVITAAKDTVNRLVMYDLTGTRIGPPQVLPVTPKSRIPLGGGLYMIKPAFGEVEAITVDERSHTVFIGDHENAMIHILKPLHLAGDATADGIVDFSDLLVVAANWMSAGCADPQWCSGADMNHSGDVDLWDFAVVAHQFGEAFLINE